MLLGEHRIARCQGTGNALDGDVGLRVRPVLVPAAGGRRFREYPEAIVASGGSASQGPPEGTSPITATADATRYADGPNSGPRLHSAANVGPQRVPVRRCRYSITVNLYDVTHGSAGPFMVAAHVGGCQRRGGVVSRRPASGR